MTHLKLKARGPSEKHSTGRASVPTWRNLAFINRHTFNINAARPALPNAFKAGVQVLVKALLNSGRIIKVAV